MELSPLTATSPVDGRYRNKTEELADYFSEYALIRYRVKVEIEYFIALCELPLPGLEDFDTALFDSLRSVYKNFSPEDADIIKGIEKTTNHDVKAVEYFIKQSFSELGLDQYKEFIHFGLTSQDINNTAVPLSVKDANGMVFLPLIEKLINKINLLAFEWKDVSMLARTHGQPASPTKLGKEIYVFSERVENQLDLLKTIPFSGKFGGATGAMNAHVVAYPEFEWEDFACKFLSKAWVSTGKRPLPRSNITITCLPTFKILPGSTPS